MPDAPLPATEFSLVRPAAAAPGRIVAEPSARPAGVAADALVLFLVEGGVGAGSAAEVDRATGGLLARLAASGELTGRRY